MKNDIVVSVCMITYNHEKFISQAIEGVLMQKTNFPIELIIGEDCSTDKTREICIEYQQKYPEIIKLQLPEINKGMMRNFIENMQAARGKHIALCEGDDYWIDPYKLQKQVDFLEANEDYGLVHTNYNVVDENNNVIMKYNHNWPSGNVFDLYFDYKYNFVTATVLFRTSLYNTYKSEIIELIKLKLGLGDAILWMVLSRHSKVKFILNTTTCYRILENSASHFTDIDKAYRFRKDTIILREHVSKMYAIKYNEKKAKNFLYGAMIKVAFEKNNYQYAKKYYIKLLENQIINVFDLKNSLFFLGARFNLFKKLISKLYIIRSK
ncbi:MAG: glycosyltransferase [Dysgonamonadaceae bacterium]|jgi:glycosyltransferase involved in cell wall biosynthesis|nr:glycosyltransferase [Dysgonamonadaceae bacterium]